MSLSILNVGHGDTKLTFDKDKPEERERAALIVGEMLRKGFAILVEIDIGGRKLYDRVTAFDPNTCEYIIAGNPGADTALPAMQATPKRRGRPAKARLPADGTRATAVARSAGGCHRDENYVRSR